MVKWYEVVKKALLPPGAAEPKVAIKYKCEHEPLTCPVG